MATRQITSEPKPSIRHRGWYYAYYNSKAASGRNCIAVMPSSLVGHVHRGFVFNDETQLQWSDELRASVLTLDFDGQEPTGPSLPPDREAGWKDSDAPATYPICDPQLLKQMATQHGIPAQYNSNGNGRAPEPPRLDPSLEDLLEQACLAFTYACRRIGVVEKPRAMEAQKIATTCLIPYLKERGVTLTDEEEKAMTF